LMRQVLLVPDLPSVDLALIAADHELHELGEVVVVAQELLAARVNRPLRSLHKRREDIDATGLELLDNAVDWERVPLALGPLKLTPLDLDADPVEPGPGHHVDDLFIELRALIVAAGEDVETVDVVPAAGLTGRRPVARRLRRRLARCRALLSGARALTRRGRRGRTPTAGDHQRGDQSQQHKDCDSSHNSSGTLRCRRFAGRTRASGPATVPSV